MRPGPGRKAWLPREWAGNPPESRGSRVLAKGKPQQRLSSGRLKAGCGREAENWAGPCHVVGLPSEMGHCPGFAQRSSPGLTSSACHFEDI